MEVGVSDTAPIDLEMIYRMAYIKTKRPERRLVDVCLAVGGVQSKPVSVPNSL